MCLEPKSPSLVVWAALIACLGCCTGNGGGVPDADEDASAADAGGDAADCLDPPPPGTVDCAQTGNCPPISIANDAPSSDTITFTGFADPTLSPDPRDPQQVWLAYSWPYIAIGRDPDGNQVLMAAVSSHLAKSEDGGRTFTFRKELYPAEATTDPEGGGEEGLLSSETVSLATMTSGNATTWYSAHMRYFPARLSSNQITRAGLAAPTVPCEDLRNLRRSCELRASGRRTATSPSGAPASRSASGRRILPNSSRPPRKPSWE